MLVIVTAAVNDGAMAALFQTWGNEFNLLELLCLRPERRQLIGHKARAPTSRWTRACGQMSREKQSMSYVGCNESADSLLSKILCRVTCQVQCLV